MQKYAYVPREKSSSAMASGPIDAAAGRVLPGRRKDTPSPAVVPPPAAMASGIPVSQGYIDIGYQVAERAVNSGKFEILDQYITDANSADSKKRIAGISVLFGVAQIFQKTLNDLAGKNCLRLTGSRLPNTDELLYSASTDARRVYAQISGILNAMKRAKDRIPTVHISVSPSSKNKEDAPAPAEVRVVEMPPRKTTTEIKRNVAGEIVSSMQIERDF